MNTGPIFLLIGNQQEVYEYYLISFYLFGIPDIFKKIRILWRDKISHWLSCSTFYSERIN